MKFNNFLAFLFTLGAILTVIFGLISEYVGFLKPKENCEDYSLFLFADMDKIDTQVGKGTLIKIRAINAGKFGDKYEVSLNGPKWVVIKPDSFSLEAEEAKTLFLYVSPNIGTEGKYDIEITVKSKCVTESQTIEVGVIKE